MAGRVVVSTLNDDTGVLATQNGMTGIAKAWVNWTYFSSTLTVQASFNVSSVTRSGAGVYVITFTTAMPSSAYCATATSSFSTSSAGLIAGLNGTSGAPFYTAPSASQYNLNFATGGGAFQDPWYASTAVFRS